MKQKSNRPVLITGGAGFIGSNVARSLLAAGTPVRVLDSLLRPGVERNVQELSAEFPQLLDVVVGDVRDATLVERVMRDASQVYHLAAQVAVTTSLEAPMADFEVNARGTLTVLEAVRQVPHRPPLLFTSTNKVYGALGDIPLREHDGRHEPAASELRATGIDESRPLDLHSPYGCSKGCADQYVLDYARCYGVRSVVFRMSCIYGPYQRGTEDQGWVAHFLLQAKRGAPITIYGDGMQVRDLLHVDDLVRAFALGMSRAASHPGEVFNMGGGPANALSLVEVLAVLERTHGLQPAVSFDQARMGDQRWFVANTARFTSRTGWQPRVAATDGISALHDWFAARDSAAEARPAGHNAHVPAAHEQGGAESIGTVHTTRTPSGAAGWVSRP